MNCEQCAVYGFCEMVDCEFKSAKTSDVSANDENHESSDEEAFM